MRATAFTAVPPLLQIDIDQQQQHCCLLLLAEGRAVSKLNHNNSTTTNGMERQTTPTAVPTLLCAPHPVASSTIDTELYTTIPRKLSAATSNSDAAAAVVLRLRYPWIGNERQKSGTSRLHSFGQVFYPGRADKSEREKAKLSSARRLRHTPAPVSSLHALDGDPASCVYE